MMLRRKPTNTTRNSRRCVLRCLANKMNMTDSRIGSNCKERYRMPLVPDSTSDNNTDSPMPSPTILKSNLFRQGWRNEQRSWKKRKRTVLRRNLSTNDRHSCSKSSLILRQKFLRKRLHAFRNYKDSQNPSTRGAKKSVRCSVNSGRASRRRVSSPSDR